MAVINLSEMAGGLAREARLIGIDPGRKRVGVALSDVFRRIATPYATLNRTPLARLAADIGDLARREGAGGLIIGLPLEMDGRAGPAAQAARDFAHALSNATGMPATLVDERLTTASVERAMIEADLSRAKRAARIDAAAAAAILQAALDRMAAMAREESTRNETDQDKTNQDKTGRA